jgi:hypothetical protein
MGPHGGGQGIGPHCGGHGMGAQPTMGAGLHLVTGAAHPGIPMGIPMGIPIVMSPPGYPGPAIVVGPIP